MAIELLRSLLEQATASGTRSTVLTDLRWCLCILLFGTLAAFEVHAAEWLAILLAILLSLTFVVYVIIYSYFAVKAPEYLRTEKYNLSKLAIERSVTGDNLSGFVDPVLDPPASRASLPAPPESQP